MPRSKRDQKISLTQTCKKGAGLKQKTMEKVREAVDEYDNVFIFNTNNIRNGRLKNVRMKWKDSRFMFGKNKVMAYALGTTEDKEYKPNIHKLAAKIVGQCGLLFTNKKKEDVIKYFKEYREPEYPSAGFVPDQTIILRQGDLPEIYNHAMEPYFRKLGMPVLLKKGVIQLLGDYTLCKSGKPITSEQSALLKIFDHKLEQFKVTIDYVWSKSDESFEKLN